jgi:hypothetical protein
MVIKGRVEGGRLRVDEPTNLPEGTEIEMVPLDPEEELDEADRKALHQLLEESEEDVKAGRFVDAADVLKGLRSR